MTDITDQDRRDALKWAQLVNTVGKAPLDMSKAAARIILATVDATAPTLTEQQRDMGNLLEEEGDAEAKSTMWARNLADKVAGIEHDMHIAVQALHDYKAEGNAADEAHDRAHAEHDETHTERDETHTKAEQLTHRDNSPTANNAELDQERLQLIAEAERPTTEQDQPTRENTSTEPSWKPRTTTGIGHADHEHSITCTAHLTAENTPDPTDIKPGEAWKALIRFDDERHPGTAIKTPSGNWNVCRADGTQSTNRKNEYVELMSRLVPAPRAITNPDELDQLPNRSVIISTDGTANIYQKDNNDEWLNVTGHWYSSQRVIHIENTVTVLGETET